MGIHTLFGVDSVYLIFQLVAESIFIAVLIRWKVNFDAMK